MYRIPCTVRVRVRVCMHVWRVAERQSIVLRDACRRLTDSFAALLRRSDDKE